MKTLASSLPEGVRWGGVVASGSLILVCRCRGVQAIPGGGSIGLLLLFRPLSGVLLGMILGRTWFDMIWG